MTLINRIKNKTLVKYYRKRFVEDVAKISDTPALDRKSDKAIQGLAVISLVQKKDIDMYLVALKSFTRFVKPEKIVLVADPTVDQADEAKVRQHVTDIEIVRMTDFAKDYTPKGSCWERLHALVHYNKDFYVIQLDADTVTHNMPIEVMDAVKASHAFTLGTKQGQVLSTVEQAAAFARQHISTDKPHIQLTCESQLDKIQASLPDVQSYVRGCAGFNGFPKGALDPEQIARLSAWFGEQVGERWAEWGSEQFMCNLLVANIANTHILPIGNYYTPSDSNNHHSRLLHFIGSMRFKNSLYRRSVNQVIQELNS